MKISIAQIKVIPGQPSQNFATIQKAVASAKKNKVDLIVFPEMCVGGYFMGDRYLDYDYLTYTASFNDKILALSDDIAIIWGNIYLGQIDGVTKGRDGRPVRFNAAFFAYNQRFVQREDGEYPGLYIKHLNPDYRVFDDSRYFFSGLELMRAQNETSSSMLKPFIFTRHGTSHKICLEVCEDLWDDDYAFKATRMITAQNPDLLINISSSPWTLNKEIARERHLKNKAIVPIIYVNAVGLQDTGKNVLLLDGGSLVFNQKGEKVAMANDRFSEELLIVDLNEPVLKQKSYQHSKLLDALLFALKQFDEAMFKQKVKWIIGLSGGIDSALNAALLTMALGKERVLAYNLPSRFNSTKTIGNAQQITAKLGISFEILPIEKLIQSSLDLFPLGVSGPVEENVHARLRGHVLSTLAQVHGGVICNNGNKVEIALGYCTLYGDTIGALSPLGDLTKMQVNDLALEINLLWGQEVIPSNLIAKIENGIPLYEFAPSAELKENQVDPMKWGYHDWLLNKLMTFPTRDINRYIDDYLNGRLDEQTKHLLKHYGLEQPQAFFKDLKWLMTQLDGSVFKRIQMPPIVMISRGAFGTDYRETQARIEQYLTNLD